MSDELMEKNDIIKELKLSVGTLTERVAQKEDEIKEKESEIKELKEMESKKPEIQVTSTDEAEIEDSDIEYLSQDPLNNKLLIKPDQ